MTEPDIWRSTNILIQRYGWEAILIAHKRANALLELGDLEGCSTWIRISRAIAYLEEESPPRRSAAN